MRLEDSPGLFGIGAGSITHGDFKCELCGKEYNIGADENEDYNNDGVRHIEFAGLGIAECCFEKIENEILFMMPDIIKWYERELLRRRDKLEADTQILQQIGRHDFVIEHLRNKAQNTKKPTSKWGEIRNEHYNDTEKCYYIDAWLTADDNENGTVIAKVYDDGKIGTVYLDKDAKDDPYAQEMIDDIIRTLEAKG